MFLNENVALPVLHNPAGESYGTLTPSSHRIHYHLQEWLHSQEVQGSIIQHRRSNGVGLVEGLSAANPTLSICSGTPHFTLNP